MLSTFELLGEDNSNTSDYSPLEFAETTHRHDTGHLAWFMSITLNTRPRCFGCGGRMLPKVVVIQSNCAICEQCSTIDWSDFRPFWLALESLGSPLELSRSRGITFWTPPPTLPDIDGYLRWIELWDIVNGPRSPASHSLAPPFVDPSSPRTSPPTELSDLTTTPNPPGRPPGGYSDISQ